MTKDGIDTLMDIFGYERVGEERTEEAKVTDIHGNVVATEYQVVSYQQKKEESN